MHQVIEFRKKKYNLAAVKLKPLNHRKFCFLKTISKQSDFCELHLSKTAAQFDSSFSRSKHNSVSYSS